VPVPTLQTFQKGRVQERWREEVSLLCHKVKSIFFLLLGLMCGWSGGWVGGWSACACACVQMFTFQNVYAFMYVFTIKGCYRKSNLWCLSIVAYDTCSIVVRSHSRSCSRALSPSLSLPLSRCRLPLTHSLALFLVVSPSLSIHPAKNGYSPEHVCYCSLHE